MSFINTERVKAYSIIFVMMYVIVGLYWILGTPGLTDRKGKPKGGDFVTFYAASILTASSKPADCYTAKHLFSVETLVSGSKEYHTTWDYPPSFLLAVLPLSMLPYQCSLLMWSMCGLLGYQAVVRKFAPSELTDRALIAFPGVFQNLIQGQNGFLTTIVLGSGLLLLETRPFMAGFLLGMLTYKPHLAWLTILALMISRRWATIAGAGIATATLFIVSGLAFSPEIWTIFLKNLPVHTKALETGVVSLAKMPTVFGGCRLLGITVKVSHIIQILLMVPVITAVLWIWTQKVPLGLRTAALSIGICMANPFLFDYDLAVLGLAVASLGWVGHTQGWLRFEKPVLLLCWLAPFGSALASATNVQITPLILIATLAIVLRRVWICKQIAA